MSRVSKISIHLVEANILKVFDYSSKALFFVVVVKKKGDEFEKEAYSTAPKN